MLKKFDIVYRRIWLNSQTHQIALSKWRGAADQQNGGPSTSAGVCSNCPSGPVGIASKTYTIDLRLVKEAQVSTSWCQSPLEHNGQFRCWPRWATLCRLWTNGVVMRPCKDLTRTWCCASAGALALSSTIGWFFVCAQFGAIFSLWIRSWSSGSVPIVVPRRAPTLPRTTTSASRSINRAMVAQTGVVVLYSLLSQ